MSTTLPIPSINFVINWLVITLSPHSIVSELLLVTDVINHMSALYDPEIEWEENPVRDVLDQKDLSAVERAIALL